MRRWFLACLLMLVTVSFTTLPAQDFAPYYSRNFFLMGSAGSFQNGLLGFANPANTAMLKTFNARFYWISDQVENADLSGWGLFTAAPGLGFGMLRQKFSGSKIYDYNVSLGAGNGRAAFGIGYTWSSGDKDFFNRENLFSAGFLYRPFRHISLAGLGSFSTQTSAREGLLELGLRPLGSSFLTLFGDYAIQKKQTLGDAPWSAGAVLELLPGISLTGRYFDSEAFTVGLNFSFGHGLVGGQRHYDENQDRQFDSYGIGLGDYTPNIFASLFSKKKTYLAMNLKGRVDYQKFQWFDRGAPRFMDILQTIRNAASDDRVDVLALNLSAMRVLPEHAWEIREELKLARGKGKKVIIFIDNAEMTEYHLASVADYIVLDPVGSLYLPGYVLGRTYLKGTLDKLGLGFDEWRFFKYKSAAETLSRDSFSEADREQFQAYTDDIYELIKREVGESRNISGEKFDALINEQIFFMAEDARQEGLVDTLGRWGDLKEVIKSLTGKKKRELSVAMLNEAAAASTDWGQPPRIAVVYALGECAMDSGIKARQLEKTLRGLAKNKSVKAIVFRVDSPGGDGMASDVVAEALKKCAEKKPVVVSQGQVAGSGGYWISMYGDTILAGPNTITGSIGVIGGWVYDKGLSGKLGMASDHVQRGDHADLGFGVRLPLLGVQIPARNLTDEERSRMEQIIRRYYAEFTEKVAKGREMTVEAVDAVGQGRFYSGADGKANGLVDEIGGLMMSIELARKMAKIPEGRKYEIIEIPKYKGLFDAGFLSPFRVQEQVLDPATLQFLKMMSERPGQPLPLLLPGTYPTLE